MQAQYEHNHSAPCGWVFRRLPSPHNNLSFWWCLARSSHASTKCAHTRVLTRTLRVITRWCSLCICHTVATLFHHPPATPPTSQQPLPCLWWDWIRQGEEEPATTTMRINKELEPFSYNNPTYRGSFSSEVWNNPRHAMHTNGCLTRAAPGNCKLASWCIRDSRPFEGMKWHCTASGCPNVLHWETHRERDKEGGWEKWLWTAN